MRQRLLRRVCYDGGTATMGSAAMGVCSLLLEEAATTWSATRRRLQSHWRGGGGKLAG